MVDTLFTIGRLKSDWYPFLFADGSKCWKLGKSSNKYYHISSGCLKTKHPAFTLLQVTPPYLDTSQVIVTAELRIAFASRFGVAL